MPMFVTQNPTLRRQLWARKFIEDQRSLSFIVPARRKNSGSFAATFGKLRRHALAAPSSDGLRWTHHSTLDVLR
jgi:hypothetical protein